MTKSILPAALVISAAAFFIGCSGSGKSTAPQASAAEKYAEFSEEINAFVGSIVDFVVQGYDEFENFDFTAAPPPIMAKVTADTTLESDTVYQNGWHIISATAQSATESISIADSIRFLDATGNPLEFPSEELTHAVYLKEHAEVTMILAEFGMSMSFVVHGDWRLVGFQTAAVAVDGAADFGMNVTASSEDRPTTMDFIYDVDLDNVTVSNPRFGGSGCAVGGSFTIDFAGAIDGYDEDGGRINESVEAAITATFNTGGTGYYVVDIDGQIFTETISGCADG